MEPTSADDVSYVGRGSNSFAPGALAPKEASVCERRKAMGDMTIQAIMWIGAGAILVFYLKRRRGRKTTS